MGQNTNIINLVGSVTNPPSTSQPDQATPPFATGRQADTLISQVHGKYYGAAYRGAVFHAQVDGVAILPVSLRDEAVIRRVRSRPVVRAVEHYESRLLIYLVFIHRAFMYLDDNIHLFFRAWVYIVK